MSDGFGDELTVEEELRRKDGLLALQAAEAGVTPNDWDDSLQEGRIAFWRTLSAGRGDDPLKYAHGSAKRAVRGVVRGRPLTGEPRHQGRGEPSTDSLDEMIEEFGSSVLLHAAEIMDGIELAYHHGEIHAAIDQLPPDHKRYIVMRFWGGMTNSEIAPVLARPVKNMARTWTEAIRPKLAAELVHLADW